MATLSQTAANVRPTATTQFDVVTAGEAVSAGMPVYLEATEGRTARRASREGAASSVAVGVAMGSAAAGQKFVIATGGDINPGGTMVAGEAYYVGGLGGIGTVSDVSVSEYATRLGIATTTTNLKLDIHPGNTAKSS